MSQKKLIALIVCMIIFALLVTAAIAVSQPKLHKTLIIEKLIYKKQQENK